VPMESVRKISAGTYQHNNSGVLTPAEDGLC
jgi:hypothetical protein